MVKIACTITEKAFQFDNGMIIDKVINEKFISFTHLVKISKEIQYAQ